MSTLFCAGESRRGMMAAPSVGVSINSWKEEMFFLFLHPPELQGAWCSLSMLGLQGGRTRPFLDLQQCSPGLCLGVGSSQPTGFCAAPERGFHLYTLFPVPRTGFSPGKHLSQSNDKDSFLLLSSTDDSFLIAFSVGSCRSFFKTCISSSYKTQGFM